MKLSATDSLGLLTEIINISNSTQDIDKRLRGIVDQLAASFKWWGCALYVLDSEVGGAFRLKVSRGAIFKEILPLEGGPAERFVRDRKLLILEDVAEGRAFIENEDIEDSVGRGGIFPIKDDKFFYGALLFIVNQKSPPREKNLSLLDPISLEIAGTMRNAQLYSNTKGMIDDLTLLNEVWAEMSSNLALDSLLDVAIRMVSLSLKAKYGMIVLEENDGCEGGLFFNEASGDDIKEVFKVLYRKLCGESGCSDGALTISDLAEKFSDGLEDLGCPSMPVLAVPFKDGGKRLGCIMLLGREDGGKFVKREQRLISTLASQVSSVVNNALLLGKMEVLNREKEVMVKELSNLFELNKAVMMSIDLDRLLHIILTAVTMGDGFGFNRAMLFLYNENSGYIQGMMGVGPDSREDAYKIWGDISSKNKTLQDLIEEQGDVVSDSKLNEMVKKLRISVEDKSIVGLTVVEKRPFNIKNAHNDDRVKKEVLETINCSSFATAPLIASGRVVGVVLVDNIYNEREITDNDIRLLTIFANQAGIAIDNSTLYKNLEVAHHQLKETQNKMIHSEKLVALGEMSAGVAHEIRNPLVSIGGFARRLSRRLEGEDNKKYIGIICKEVERLEHILNDILVFSREERAELETHDINKVINDTLDSFARDFTKENIELHLELNDSPTFVKANYHQLMQVFINLFSNAKSAMGEGGVLRIKSFLSTNKGEENVSVEISDTGGGIPYNVMSNIFNPFFTTKDDGTGLGLAITHKIISMYNGDIEVVNNDEGGATFIISIPSCKVGS